MLTVSVDGPIAITNSDGLVVTPTGKKTRGLVALLIYSQDFRRARSWIQDKLWSDRGPEQASSSLRQALSELRKCLGKDADAVLTERGCIQLDPKQFTRLPCKNGSTSEICEDLDINDAEFENWIREIRLFQSNNAMQPTPQKQARKPVVIIASNMQPGTSSWCYAALKDEIIRSLLETSDIQIFDLDTIGSACPSRPGPTAFVQLNLTATESSDWISSAIQTASGHRTVWQSPREELNRNAISRDETIWRIRSFGQSLVARIINELERQADAMGENEFAIALFNRARRLLFDFGRENLIKADRLLKAAFEIAPHSTYLSWRAFLRNTARFEHLTDDFLEHCDPYRLHEEALRTDASNSINLVFAAQHSFLNEGDADFGLTLVNKALEQNPSNPLAWGFQSNMFLMNGAHAEARKASDLGLRLSQGQPDSSIMAVFACMSQIAVQDYEGAVMTGRLSVMNGSDLQAMRRYMFALYQALDEPVLAKQALHSIRQREPDFVAQNLTDPNYPLRTLQMLPIVDRFKV